MAHGVRELRPPERGHGDGYRRPGRILVLEDALTVNGKPIGENFPVQFGGEEAEEVVRRLALCADGTSEEFRTLDP